MDPLVNVTQLASDLVGKNWVVPTYVLFPNLGRDERLKLLIITYSYNVYQYSCPIENVIPTAIGIFEDINYY